jgi:hypothetical protein
MTRVAAICATACLMTAHSASGQDVSAVTVTVRNDARVPPEQLAESLADVSRTFSAIGVEIVWRSAANTALEEPLTTSRSRLTIVILSSSKARRMAADTDVVGLTPAGVDGPGRIAYIFYDRIAHVAATEPVRAPDFLGLVIAHEMGHLLLPARSHSADGLMRQQWRAAELRKRIAEKLHFTREQAEEIRRRLRVSANAP